MVVAAANAMERMLENAGYLEAITLEKRQSEAIIESITVGILSVGMDGRIHMANQHASGMFGYSVQELCAANAADLFDSWTQVLERSRVRASLLDEEVMVHARRNKVRFTLSTYPILGPSDSLHGLVLVIKDVHKVRRLATRIMGQRAIFTFDKMIGEDPKFLELKQYAMKLADSRSTLLITGEHGTGKELFAQAIHNASSRSEEAFVAVHCGAFPLSQMEAQLFGLAGEALSISGSPGKIAIADGGTLYLDEVDEMPLEMQPLLLKLIEGGIVSRADGRVDTVVDVRVIASSSRSLDEAVRAGRLRKDLFFRLNVLPLHLLPLRERRSDIPLLMRHALQRQSERLNKRQVVPTDVEMASLKTYDWPGNIRELENFAALAINLEHVPVEQLAQKRDGHVSTDGHCVYASPEILTLQEMEDRHIRHVVAHCSGNMAAAARILGISRNTLYRKMASPDT